MAVTPEELARTLVRRQQERLDAQLGRARVVRAVVAGWVSAAQRAGRVRRAWLIGSLAWGGFGADSDVDVVVEGLNADHQGRTWAELSKALGTPVDLLRLEELPPDFAARVLREGVALP